MGDREKNVAYECWMAFSSGQNFHPTFRPIPSNMTRKFWIYKYWARFSCP